MSNAFKDAVGVTIEERVTNAFNYGDNTSTRNIGLLVDRERGIENTPVLINNLKEDSKIFGGHGTDKYSSYVVETLFNNSGGYQANVYQIRVVGEGSVSASNTVKNANPNLQSMTTQTTQNASATQAQIDVTTIANVGIGDSFTYELVVMDGTAKTFTHTEVAETTLASDLVTKFKDALELFFADLTLVPTVYTSGNSFTVTSQVNQTMTSTSSSTNNATEEAIFQVYAGRFGKKDKGTWGNNLRVRVYPIGHPNGSADGYKMEVFYKGYLVETFISDGTDWQTLINKINLLSEYVMAIPVDLSVSLTLGVFDASLTGGVYVAPTEADFTPRYHEVTQEPLGMQLFEGVDVQVVACPEIFSTSFAKECEDFARANMKHFVFNMPYMATESTLESYYNALFTNDQSFASGYGNWVEVPADNIGNKIWIPAIGYVLGAGYVKKAGLYNNDVWTPPAGVETNAKGIYRITHDTVSDATLSRYIKKWRCNMIKFIKNVGFCIWSSRTYSTNALFESIHIRLETNWMLDILLNRNQDALQKIITPSVTKKLRIDNLIWFKNLYERGGIEQSIPFDDAVVITVEQDKANRKEVTMDIAWIPPECLEHLHIRLNRNDGILILNF